MDVKVEEAGKYLVVRLAGDVDLSSSPRAREAILDSIERERAVLVDLSAVDYIDSSGVAGLVEGYQLAKQNRMEFGLVNVSDKAMNVIRLAHLDRVFPIYNSLEELVGHAG